MKTTLLCYFTLATSIAASPALALGPTPEEIQSQVRGAYVFEVTPSLEGRVAACRVVGTATAPNGEHEAPDTPSTAYVKSACEVAFGLAANWVPVLAGDGSVQSVNETCLWSEATPDQAICRSELGISFADEIPRGIGNLVVFELVANGDATAVSCEFSGMTSLATGKALQSKPHELYLKDACRKLQSIQWKNKDMAPGHKFYFPCRHIEQVPARAFCERDFGL